MNGQVLNGLTRFDCRSKLGFAVRINFLLLEVKEAQILGYNDVTRWRSKLTLLEWLHLIKCV